MITIAIHGRILTEFVEYSHQVWPNDNLEPFEKARILSKPLYRMGHESPIAINDCHITSITVHPQQRLVLTTWQAPQRGSNITCIKPDDLRVSRPPPSQFFGMYSSCTLSISPWYRGGVSQPICYLPVSTLRNLVDFIR
jgi:hypothetical protein